MHDIQFYGYLFVSLFFYVGSHIRSRQLALRVLIVDMLLLLSVLVRVFHAMCSLNCTCLVRFSSYFWSVHVRIEDDDKVLILYFFSFFAG